MSKRESKPTTIASIDWRMKVTVERARALRTEADPVRRALLQGLRLAFDGCLDQAEAYYAAADRADSGEARRLATAKAAAAKFCAEQIGVQFDASSAALAMRLPKLARKRRSTAAAAGGGDSPAEAG
jgi:hypothetical protein